MRPLSTHTPVPAPAPVLTVRDLSVSYPTTGGSALALQQVSFDLWPGETLALVGESGCGKSTLARALLGLVPPPGRVTGGTMRLGTHDDLDLVRLPERAWRRLRGQAIGLVSQDPLHALDPVQRIDVALAETLRTHRRLDRAEVQATSVALLQQLGLEPAERVLQAYPFQLSGGMCQRVTLALALAGQPQVLVADEPTTALDVRVQAEVLAMIQQLQHRLGIAQLLITHDVSVAAEVADRIAVMYAGRIVEIGPTAAILEQPAHPYTRALLRCVTTLSGGLPEPIPGQPPSLVAAADRCAFLPRCPVASERCQGTAHPQLEPGGALLAQSARAHEVACYHPERGAQEIVLAPSGNHLGPAGASARRQHNDPGPEDIPLLAVHDLCKTFHRRTLAATPVQPVLDHVSLTVRRGEIVGLVGASGSGKSTLARCILRLVEPTAGALWLDGQNLLALRGEALRQARRRIQPIFQDARGALNPRRTVLELVGEPLHYFGIGTRRERAARAAAMLIQVGLPANLYHRLPHQLSTGQCQRVVIARALVLEPEVLICDEPLSALDVSAQAQIVRLLVTLQTRLRFGMLLISHDLSLVQRVCHRIVVIDNGQVCEELPASAIATQATHPVTRALLAALPRLARGGREVVI